jgi:hypothetical protein
LKAAARSAWWRFVASSARYWPYDSVAVAPLGSVTVGDFRSAVESEA